MISPVSFGKKIPIAEYSLPEKATGISTPVTLYEIDCSDEEDVQYAKNLDGDWFFKEFFSGDIEKKFKIKNADKQKNQEVDYSVIDINSKKFYVAETNNGKPIGLCEVGEDETYTNISLIESEHEKKYKYCAQSILAILGIRTIKNNKNLIIITPIDSAKNFYIDKCNFHKSEFFGLAITKSNLKEFIGEVEKRTNSKIVDLSI